MDHTIEIVAAMAQQCRRLIERQDNPDRGLPPALQPQHLLWMCNKIEEHADDGSTVRLHRWLGFVQAGLLANRMLDLKGLKAMFDEVKKAHAISNDDFADLVDHLDPTSSFEFDVGGEG